MKKNFTTLFAILLMATISQAQWSLTGNAGTDTAVNLIGTTDRTPLVFRVNNYFSGLLDSVRRNTSFGVKAMMNTTSVENTAMGALALTKNTTGGANTAIGTLALSENTTAVSSTAVGAFSLKISTGVANTAVGQSALYKCTSGAINTAVGYAADFNVTAFYNNTTAIGCAATVTASNQVRIGSSTVTSIGGVVDWTTVSDGRFKSNIQSNVPGLAFINQLKPVTYTLNVSELSKFLRPGGITDNDGKKLNIPGMDDNIGASEKMVRTGFIAQDVAAAAEKAGFDFDGIDKPKNDKDIYGLRYAEFVTPLVQAVQELSKTNDSLRSVINDIMQQIKELKNGQGASLSGVLPVLKQNNPNPFNSNTVIGYFIPTASKSAQLIVTNVKGQLLKNISLNKYGEGQITIHSGELAAGSYFYTLTVDGQRIDTRQMILTK